MSLSIEQATLVIIMGVLLAIVFSLRYLVIMDRRVARMEVHIERLAGSILKEEKIIEGQAKKKKR